MFDFNFALTRGQQTSKIQSLKKKKQVKYMKKDMKYDLVVVVWGGFGFSKPRLKIPIK